MGVMIVIFRRRNNKFMFQAMGGIKEIKPMFESESLHELAESFEGKSGPVQK